MRRLALVALLACTPPPPAQQVADFTAAEQCTADHWGQPPAAIAAACFAGDLTAAIDVIADVVTLFDKADAGAAAYASDPAVSARVKEKRP
jgi:hypothetical protein